MAETAVISGGRKVCCEKETVVPRLWCEMETEPETNGDGETSAERPTLAISQDESGSMEGNRVC